MSGGFAIHASDEGAVRTLVMSNPGKRNAITIEGFTLLADALEAFAVSDARVLVLTGDGGDFSSGADLSGAGVAGNTAAQNARLMAAPGRAAAALHASAKPTIAAVDGVAMGAGMNLALGCDLIYATERARFAEVFVRRGLVMDFGGTWLLPRLVGLARARELALTGEEVGPERALADGMITGIIDSERLRSEVGRRAAELAAGAPLAQAFIKSALFRSATMSFEQALRFEEQIQAVLLGTEDVAEAVAAFFAKRAPEFRGR
jgi:enoyl-CoA hydratase/carnithine racemase